ncbi:unnamed protein product [Rhizoctonia solani]|uniref:PWI domain-containing protein n=1 Tax=Rhizoctonia solani TaxID=456999 RepID=A0A8H3CF27_9AGAM|nr:unnamed protein product [Rhizoctonia solani]
MADAGFFKGTSAEQDRRFADKEHRLLKSMKFPPEFDRKVDMRKVNLQVMRPWITKKVVELVGFEDEVVVEYAMGLLEDQSKPPDPKVMQINLTGFLESKTPAFMSALWTLLLEAQTSPAGVPASFVQEKKEELRQKHEADERALAEARRRGEHDLRLDEASRSVNASVMRDADAVVDAVEAIHSVVGLVIRDGATAVGEVDVEETEARRVVVHRLVVEAGPHLHVDGTDARLHLGRLLQADVVGLRVGDALLLPEDQGAPLLVDQGEDAPPIVAAPRRAHRLSGLEADLLQGVRTTRSVGSRRVGGMIHLLDVETRQDAGIPLLDTRTLLVTKTPQPFPARRLRTRANVDEAT